MIFYFFLLSFNKIFSINPLLESFKCFNETNVIDLNLKNNSDVLRKKIFYIKNLTKNSEIFKSDIKSIYEEDMPTCDNEICICKNFKSLFNFFKKKYIFPQVVEILKEFLKSDKKRLKKTNFVLCSIENTSYEISENFLNFLKNLVNLLENSNQKNNINIISYLCNLSQNNTFFLEKTSDILFDTIENNNKKSILNSIKNIFNKKDNSINNEDYMNLIDFIDFFYNMQQKINLEDLQQISYKRYKLLVYGYLKNEKIPTIEEKKLAIDNVLKICQENEKNTITYKKLNEFIKKIL